MISYHPERGLGAAAYAAGFRTVDTNAVERIAKGIALYTWSPCIWDGGARKRVNFLRADWAVLDFDSGEMTLAEALNTWCDCIHVIGTTKSHQREKDGKPACDRFRVALLFELPVTVLADYEHTVGRLIAHHGADPSGKDGARFFFPCREIVSTSSEGMAEEPLAAPPVPATPVRRIAAGVYPAWIRDALKNGTGVGGRHKLVYRLGANLCHAMGDDEIVALIMSSPLSALGISDVERTVRDGAKRGRSEGQVSGD